MRANSIRAMTTMISAALLPCCGLLLSEDAPVDVRLEDYSLWASRSVTRCSSTKWIKEGKGAIKWTRLSCRTFAANAVQIQLRALAYNLGNFLRTLATPEPIKDWSLTSLKGKLIKIGGKVVSHGCYVVFQMAEVAIHDKRSRRFCG